MIKYSAEQQQYADRKYYEPSRFENAGLYKVGIYIESEEKWEEIVSYVYDNDTTVFPMTTRFYELINMRKSFNTLFNQMVKKSTQNHSVNPIMSSFVFGFTTEAEAHVFLIKFDGIVVD